MTKRKLKIIEPPEPVQVSYYVHDRATFQIAPTRNTPEQTFEGVITCTPETSVFGCYHIKVDSEMGEWFVLRDEIIEKIGEQAA